MRGRLAQTSTPPNPEADRAPAVREADGGGENGQNVRSAYPEAVLFVALPVADEVLAVREGEDAATVHLALEPLPHVLAAHPPAAQRRSKSGPIAAKEL